MEFVIISSSFTVVKQRQTSHVLVFIPGVYTIQCSQPGPRSWDVGAHLSHNTDKSHLPDVGALTPHIRTSDYHSSPAITLLQREEKRE